jgi:hypothetical protein
LSLKAPRNCVPNNGPNCLLFNNSVSFILDYFL